jgi:hypothetical protein
VGFSSIDLSPSAYLSGQPCRTTTWTTATQLVCAAPSPVLATGALHARPSGPLAAARPPLGAAGAAREMWVKVAATTACEGFTFDGALPQ